MSWIRDFHRIHRRQQAKSAAFPGKIGHLDLIKDLVSDRTCTRNGAFWKTGTGGAG